MRARILYAAKFVRLPGFKGESLYDISRYFVWGLRRPAFSLSAQAMAFTFFLSIFPTLILAFQLLAYVPIEGLQSRMLRLIRDFLPTQSHAIMSRTVADLFDGAHWGIISLTALSALFTASRGMLTLINALDAIDFRPPVRQNPLKKNLKALGLLAMFLIFFLAGAAFVVVAEIALGRVYQTVTPIVKTVRLEYYLMRGARW
ncbi:MAG: YihY/virulence factor BrkB family protein, partial [Bacteroidia bacterium]|nr:YihY/virulence factor BrkB family protein [Bacteroidia bacterium]